MSASSTDASRRYVSILSSIILMLTTRCSSRRRLKTQSQSGSLTHGLFAMSIARSRTSSLRSNAARSRTLLLPRILTKLETRSPISSRPSTNCNRPTRAISLSLSAPSASFVKNVRRPRSSSVNSKTSKTCASNEGASWVFQPLQTATQVTHDRGAAHPSAF